MEKCAIIVIVSKKVQRENIMFLRGKKMRGSCLNETKMKKSGPRYDLQTIIEGVKCVEDLVNLLIEEIEKSPRIDKSSTHEVIFQMKWDTIVTYLISLLEEADRWKLERKNIIHVITAMEETIRTFRNTATSNDNKNFTYRERFIRSMERLSQLLKSLDEAIMSEQKDEKFNSLSNRLMLMQDRRRKELANEIDAMITEMERIKAQRFSNERILRELQTLLGKKKQLEDRIEKENPDIADELYYECLEEAVQDIFGIDLMQLTNEMTTDDEQNEEIVQEEVTIEIPKSLYAKMKQMAQNEKANSEDKDKMVEWFEELQQSGIEIQEKREEEQIEGRTENLVVVRGIISITQQQKKEIEERENECFRDVITRLNYQNLKTQVKENLCEEVFWEALGEINPNSTLITRGMKIGDNNGRAAAILARTKEEKEREKIPHARTLTTIDVVQKMMDLQAVETEIEVRTGKKTQELLQLYEAEFIRQLEDGRNAEIAEKIAREKVFDKAEGPNKATDIYAEEGKLPASQLLTDIGYLRLINGGISALMKKYIELAEKYYIEMAKVNGKSNEEARIAIRNVGVLNALEELSQQGGAVFLQTIIENNNTIRTRIEEKIARLERVQKAYENSKKREWSTSEKKSGKKITDEQLDKWADEMEEEKINTRVPVLKMRLKPKRERKREIRATLRTLYEEKAKPGEKPKRVGLFISKEEEKLAIQALSVISLAPNNLNDSAQSIYNGEVVRAAAKQAAKQLKYRGMERCYKIYCG